MRRLVLAALVVIAFCGDLAWAQSLLVSSQIPSVPSGVLLDGSVPPGTSTIVDNAAQNTVVGTLSTVNGVAPFTYTDTDNSKFTISGSNLVRSGTGSLTAGVSESVNIRSTDANNNTFTTASAFSIAVSAHGSGNFIETIELENDTGSTQAANFVTPMFGLGLKKADLPTTQYPVFQLNDGTALSCSVSTHHTTWADGSWKIGAAMCIIPSSVAASGGTLAINVYSGGAAPTASGRALADFAAGSEDLNVTVVGQDNLSGTWVSDFNQGATAHGADYTWMDGPAGKCWRVRASFRQSAADHGQLEGWWYACSLQYSSALAGLRYLPAVTQPYYNQASPAPDYRSFSSIQILNGASLVADPWTSYGAGRTFTSTGSGTSLTSTAHALQSGWLLKVSTSGTLPSPLSAATTYFAGNTGANTFAIGTNPSNLAGGGGKITLTSAGSGVQTATPYPYVTQFATMYLANTDGTWRFAQGNGSFSADSVVRVIQNNLYLRSSGLIPPYDFGTYTPTSNSTCDWYIMTACFVTRGMETTGERFDLGPETTWAVRYWFRHTATDERVLRATALVGGELPLRLRDATTRMMAIANNTTYSGMPAANSNIYWTSDCGTSSGIIVPTHTSVCNGGFDELNTSHLPDFAYPAYLVTGEPQYHDQMADTANMAVYSRFKSFGTALAALNGPTSIGGTIGAQRNGTINGTSYYGWRWNSGNLTRSDAWGSRDVGAAAAAVTDAEGANVPVYLTDLDHVTYDAANAYLTMLQGCCTYPYTNGIWAENNTGFGGVLVPWANNYLKNAVAMDYARNEYAGALTFANYIVKWDKHVHDTFGKLWVPSYHNIVRQTTNLQTSPYVTSDDGIDFSGQNSVTWDASTDRLTISSNMVGYTVTNGDKIMFNNQAGAIPAGLSGETPYYFVNVSGSTAQVATAPAGSPIDLTNTGSNNSGEVGLYSTSVTTHVVGTSGLDYVASAAAALHNLQSVGGTVDSTTTDDEWNYMAAQPSYPAYFTSDPKYAMQGTR
jgi:hypothetical protein